MTNHGSNTEKTSTALRKAVTLHNQGNLAEAEKLYDAILRDSPNHADTLHLLGLLRHQNGAGEQARTLIQRAIDLSPNNTLYYNNLATVCVDMKLYEAATNAARIAASLAPHNPDMLATFGIALQRFEQSQQAESVLRQALALNPSHLDALLALGHLLVQEKRYEEATDPLQHALAIAPENITALVNLGKGLLKLGRTQEALTVCKRAHSLEPSSSVVTGVLADALLQGDDPESAATLLEQAAHLHPDNANVLNDLGHVVRDTKRHFEAPTYFHKALEIQTEHVDAHVNLGLTLLSHGMFQHGWKHYAYRSKQELFSKSHHYSNSTEWDDGALKGGHAMVWTEQGLGDEILQMSLVPDLVATAQDVTLVCAERLTSICRRSFPNVKVISRELASDRDLPSAPDVACPLLDTARLLRKSENMFPVTGGYFIADASLRSELRTKYTNLCDSDAPPFIVCLSWQSQHPLYGARNTIPLKYWAPILRASKNSRRPVVFVTSQYAVDTVEVKIASEESGVKIHFDAAADHGGNLELAAAQLAASDLVISTSTTTAQLAGALGKDVWHLPATGLACGWYWLTEGEKTPWYPTMRQFRRTERHAFTEQIDNVASALKKRFSLNS